MSKPVILAIDDDVSVLEAVVQDLRRRYAASYRILRAGSGQAALDLAKQLKQRSESVALFLSDQRMPGMNGTEFLERSIEIFPDAKRALLTAYSDTEAAIRAINAARIHYYLTKPWDPPEEKLYPVIDDLLETWCDTHKAPFEGLRVVGARYALRDHNVRQFLTRNYVPYVWLDVESSPEAQQLLEQNSLTNAKLPVLFFNDGSYIEQPAQSQLAERIGLRTQPSQDVYDLVVMGAGLAGLAAGVYGASEGLRTLVIEQEAPGGQAGTSSRIENYLGFPTGLSGAELAQRAYQQAVRFNVEFLSGRAASVRSDQGYHFVCLGDGTGGLQPDLPDCHGRGLATAGCSWCRTTYRRRHLLRSSPCRSPLLQGRRGIPGRRRQLRRAGRHGFRPICPPGRHPGTGLIPRKQHVEILNR